jgi:Fic family protein
MYIWERPDWPDLTWDSGHLAALLGQASREQGRLLGRMQEDVGFDLRREAQPNTLTEDVVRSSEIEGEKLDSDQVRSSIAAARHGCWRPSAGRPRCRGRRRDDARRNY